MKLVLINPFFAVPHGKILSCVFSRLKTWSCTKRALPMHSGFRKPIVITNVGGTAETVIEGETGFIVEPRNPIALADAIERFYNAKSSVNFEQNLRVVSANNFAKTLQVFHELENLN